MFEKLKEKINPLLMPLDRFWLWWTQELSTFAGRFSKTRTGHEMESGRNALLFDLSEGWASVSKQKGNEFQPIGKFNIADHDPKLMEPFFSDLAAIITDDMQVIIRLPKKYCLCKRLNLPKVDKADIRAVLQNQIDRLTPYKADQVYFDYRIIEERNTQDQCLIDFYILPRNKCAGLIDILKEHNISVDSLLYESDLGAGQNINFLSPLDCQPKKRGQKSDHLGKIGVLAALVATVYLLPLGYNHYRIGVLTDEIAAIASKAKASAKVKNSYEKLRREARFLVNKKKARPLTVQLINEVSQLLKDDTWLDQLTLKSDSLQLFGYSSSASKVLNVLEQSSLFQDSHFMAAVVHQKKFDAERFHIAVKLDLNSSFALDTIEESGSGEGKGAGQ